MLLTSPATPTDWRTPLTELGFTADRRRAGYRLNGTLFTTVKGWPTLQSSKPITDGDPLRGQLDRPGLWRMVRFEGLTYRLFEMPPVPAVVVDEDDERSARPDAMSCLTWALMTAHGTLPGGWQPPPRDEVESWMSRDALTVSVGSALRQGELIHRADRLALRFPIVPRIPATLSPARRGWLEELLTDAQDRWRLVRIGLSGSGSETAWAEVDLTGCPGPVLESLFRASLGALRWVVEWLAGSADFLVDPGAKSQALEVSTATGIPRGKEE